MSTEQPDALRLATILGNEFDTYTDTWSAKEAAAELRRQHAEIETLRTGYKAARLEIASLHAQLEAAQTAPVGMQPTARIRYERNTPGRENEMPRVLSCNRMADGVYEVFTASQVQAMLAAVPRNATLYDPDDVAFSARCCADGTDAPTELTSMAKQASTAAAKKGGQHGAE